MSLSFLGKKSFHPSNPKNMMKLHAAEEQKAHEERRAEELKREHEQEETRRASRQMLHEAGQKRQVEAPASTSFMYQAPPGLREAQEKRARQEQKAKIERDRPEMDPEKFELLKNAPTRGAHTLEIDVHHQPFGVLLRNSKCKRCGEWGHSAGDRECPMRGAGGGPTNPELDDANKARDDPLAHVSAGAEASGGALRWAPKAAAEDRVHGGASSEDANQQYVASLDDEELAAAATAGGSAGGGGASLADLDPAVLSLLSEKQQRKLLKMYQKEMRGDQSEGIGEGGDERGEKKKKRKHEHKHKSKKEKHKSSSSKKSKREHRSGGGDGGSASSGSDSEG